MTDYDLIICGAGPSGAMAAATAAQAGLKVLLLEKYPLPRHKPCGGGTPMVMHNLLRDLAPEAFVEANVLYMRHTWKFSDPYLGALNPPDSQQKLSLWMMQRPIFDMALVQRAVRYGAELRDGVAVRSLQVENNQVTVRARSMKQDGSEGRSELVATAQQVIGADGANGIVAKVANLRQKRAIALAMEIELPHEWDEQHPFLRPEILHLEYGAIQHGYAWIFPKADHLNIGAGVFRSRHLDVRTDPTARTKIQKTIFDYLDQLQIPYQAEALKFHAHPLPTWNGKEALHTADGRILLVGDAAGLINPVFGDGLLHAVKSGIIAATCVAEGNPQAYTDRIHAEFAANFETARKLAFIFYQFPALCYRYGVKHPKGSRLATQLLSGNRQFSGLFGRTLRRIGLGLFKDLLPVQSQA